MTTELPEQAKRNLLGQRKAGLSATAQSRPTGRVIAPADARDAAPETATSRPFGWHLPLHWQVPQQISLEAVLYLVLAALAVASRFWNLGYQAEHHDESLHSYFSWLYYTGVGYSHDPLMHGPFLFHLAAFVYLLFGDSDATSRYGAAFISVLTVLLPWFLRREFGRWGALSASVLLLCSPSFLYFGRFHRHDVYSAFFTLLLFIAIVRYVGEQRPVWALTGAAAWAFLFTNKEDFFIVTAIFGAGLALAILWPAARRVLLAGAGFVVLLGLVAKVLPKLLGWPGLPAIPWDSPSNEQIRTYAINLLVHPVVLATIFLFIGFLVVVLQIVTQQIGKRTLADGLFGSFAPGTPMAAAGALLRDRRTLAWAAIVFVGIYTVLYTSFFTNLGGILTGSFGAIFYWLGQHDVRRAEQPWFYYLLLVPQYDPIPAFLGAAGLLLTVWRLLAHRLFGWAEGRDPFMRGLLVYWGLATVAIYSWAGEKMPWMDIHLVLPFLLMAALVLGPCIEQLWQTVLRQRQPTPVVVVDEAEAAAEIVEPAPGAAAPGVALEQPAGNGVWLLFGTIFLACVALLLGAARLSAGGDGATERGWWWLLVPVVVIFGGGVVSGLRSSWRRSGQTVLLALTAALLFCQVHAGWRLAFQEGDVPKDLLVYVQSAPDVTRVAHELDEFSRLKTGGLKLSLLYDDSSSWPYQWYLRNYPNKQFFSCSAGSCTLTEPPAEHIAVVLVGKDNLGSHPELTGLLSNYQATDYAMRWHFPENETYRPFAIAPELKPGWSAWQYEAQPHDLRAVIGSVVSSLATTATPDGQARLFRLLAYRELGTPLGSYDFTVFVRKDLVPEYNTIRYR